eukprot:CAMPEP_0197891392 /NCGR_PEP_ID=MMETSP1439-20131203/28380_1 /TAXON_ID=66791 /ORGANISM="Gonyaulax spinifera, Strain CCMP409" /LENGTH=61 /DNA_ID=CAMNT_0043511495 /DNA_START=63 /DNA_END=245 /DNA_ORIENTATION=-
MDHAECAPQPPVPPGNEDSAPPHMPNCCTASFPVASSAARIPATQIIAKRPLLISRLRISV